MLKASSAIAFSLREYFKNKVKRSYSFSGMFGTNYATQMKKMETENFISAACVTGITTAMHISFDRLCSSREIKVYGEENGDVSENGLKLRIREVLARPECKKIMSNETLAIGFSKAVPPLKWFFMLAGASNCSLDWLFRGRSVYNKSEKKLKYIHEYESADIHLIDLYNLKVSKQSTMYFNFVENKAIEARLIENINYNQKKFSKMHTATQEDVPILSFKDYETTGVNSEIYTPIAHFLRS